jgi:hypothetical protein
MRFDLLFLVEVTSVPVQGWLLFLVKIHSCYRRPLYLSKAGLLFVIEVTSILDQGWPRRLGRGDLCTWLGLTSFSRLVISISGQGWLNVHGEVTSIPYQGWPLIPVGLVRLVLVTSISGYYNVPPLSYVYTYCTNSFLPICTFCYFHRDNSYCT